MTTKNFQQYFASLADAIVSTEKEMQTLFSKSTENIDLEHSGKQYTLIESVHEKTNHLGSDQV